MARDRGARYRTAKEMADELHRFSAGQLLRSREYSTRELVARWIARHRAAVLVAAAALLVVAIGGTLSVRAIVRGRDDARFELVLGQLERGRQLLVDGKPSEAAPVLAGTLGELAADTPDGVLARRLATRAERDVDRHLATYPSGVRATFSPDGRELAIGRDDGGIDFADSATGRVRHSLEPVGGGAVTHLRYLTSGRALVATSDRGAYVRDPRGGHDVALAPEQINDATTVGDLVVLATAAGVRVVRADGTVVAHDELPSAGRLDVSPDGSELLAIGIDVARVWHLPDLTRVVDVPGAWWGRLDGAGGVVLAAQTGLHRYMLTAPDQPIELSRAQGQPVSRLPDGTLAMADVLVDLAQNTTRPYTTLVYPETVAGLDRTRFVTGGFDHMIRIWDRERLALPIATLDATAGTSDFAVDATGTRVASIPWQGAVELWSTAGLREPVVVKNVEGSELRRILVGGPHLVIGLHPDSRAEILGDAYDRIGAAMPGWLMAISNHDEIVMNDNGRLFRYDGTTGAPIGSPISDADRIAASDMSPSGRVMASAAAGVITLRDARTGERIGGFPTGTDNVSQVVVDDDGHAATGHDDGMLRFWNARTGALVSAHAGHAGHVERMSIRGARGDLVFTESWDQTVRAWRLATGEPLGVVLTNVRGAIAISGDGRLIATSETGTAEVDVWDVDLRDGARGRLVDRVPATQIVTALAFVDDTRVLAGGRGGAMEVIDLADAPRGDGDLVRLASELPP